MKSLCLVFDNQKHNLAKQGAAHEYLPAVVTRQLFDYRRIVKRQTSIWAAGFGPVVH